MTLSPYIVTVITKQDAPYNVVPNAPIEIRERLSNGSSGSLSLIYEDQLATIPITQIGATADTNGQFVFYAVAAEYNAVYQSQTVPVDMGLTTSTLQAPLDLALISDLSQAYEFDTTIDFQNSAVAFPIGKRITIKERESLRGGELVGYIALTSSIIPDSFKKIQSVNVPTQSLVIPKKGSKYTEGTALGVGMTLMQQLNADRRDVYLLVQGDSTGNETNEWVYLVSQFLAGEFTSFTVNYYLWNAGTGLYDTPVVISAGSGGNTLKIYNASIPGSSSAYFGGGRRPAVYAGFDFDLIIRNYGHNNGSFSDLKILVDLEMEACTQLMYDQPNAEISLILQNIDTSVESFSSKQVNAARIVSQALGFGVIDIRSVFAWKQETGVLGDWMGDSVHPNTVGRIVLADVVCESLVNPNKHTSRSNNPLSQQAPSPIPNQFFDAWDWNTGDPLSWSNIQTIVTREPTIKESGYWSVKAEGNASIGNTGYISIDLSGYLKQRATSNKGFFAMARVFVDLANVSSNPGRVNIVTDVATLGSGIRNETWGGWMWRMVSIPQSMIETATTMEMQIFTGDTRDTVYIDRVAIIEGNIPHEPLFDSKEVFSEYYYDDNVGFKATNNITVTGDSVVMNSTSESFPSWFINVYNLIPGEQYTFEWSSTEAVGSVLAREVLGDAGTVLATANPLSLNKLTWRPTKTTGSLQISSLLGNEPFTLSGLTIKKGS